MKTVALAFYEVRWSDSETCDGWNKSDDLALPTKLCISYGFYVKQNDEYFVIAADYDDANHSFNRFIFIPKVNIKKKRKIQL